MKHVRNTLMLVIFFFAFTPAALHAASLLVSWAANSESDIAGYKVYYGTQPQAYGTPVDAGNVTSFQLNNAASGTTYYIAITAYDTSGNESSFSTESSITVPAADTTAPTGTISINAGSPASGTRVVNLTLSALDASGSVVSMRISNNGVDWSAEGAYATTQSWVLAEGDGVKTVYVMYKDAAGNWSQPVSDTISLLLDTDGDGVSDAWEVSYGLDPSNPSDAALDSDSDGFSNLEEYYNNTVPVLASDGLPVARAGADSQVAPMRVYLDGSTSTDPHNLSLTYSWSFVSGPASVAIENATSARANFVGIKTGTYRFTLTCSNGKSQASDAVDVTILNVAPTVSAGDDMTILVSTPVTLHATGADSNEDNLTYQWRLVSGPAAVADRSGQDNALTLASAGQYTFAVTCSDGLLSSAADQVNVTVNAANNAPTAEAGSSQTVQLGSQVALDGSASADPDGNTLRYAWSLVSGPAAVTIQNSTTAAAYFTPTVTGSYVVRLVVSDGYVSSTADTVTITVVKLNNAPVADAGDDQAAYVGDTIALDASGSYDADGDSLSYAWTQASGATVALSGAGSARPTFTPTTSGVVELKVTVSDGQVTAQDTVAVTVDNVNQVPVADAGSDRTVQVGTAVTLNGGASSDPDGDAISYIWAQTDGTQVSLGSSNTAAPSFIPAVAGTYTFSLKVYDGKDTSPADTVTVTVSETTVSIALATPSVGEVVSTNPTLSWRGSGMSKYRVYITVNNRKYSNVYTGTGTSCRMNSALWNWFLASGTTVYWYVDGTVAGTGATSRSAVAYFKKR